jgi:ribosomal protein S12 methylthiotransferase accessory factor
VVNITLIEWDSTRCFLAFGSHPSFEVALTRTLTELLQGQDIKHFIGFQKPVASRALAADSANLEAHFVDSSGVVSWGFFKKKADFPFRQVGFQGSRTEELTYLISIIHKTRKDIYIADFAESGFYTCRIVVPGMSEIYPVDDLVSANYNRGMKFRQKILRLPSLNKNALTRLLEEINSGYVGDEEIVPHLIGIAFDDASPWSQVCFGELKMLLQLAAGRTREARQQLAWCFDTGCLRREIQPLYECVSLILEKKDASIDLARFFDAAVVKKARRFARGIGVFDGLFDSRGEFLGIRAHQHISSAFARARRMRE